jgi:glutathione reductase (NADPH)
VSRSRNARGRAVVATHRFDLVVIGAGMAGFAAIGKAAAHGARAALIERGELGGT